MTGQLNIKLFLHLLEGQRQAFEAQGVAAYNRANEATIEAQKWVWNAKGEAFNDASRQIFVLKGLLTRE